MREALARSLDGLKGMKTDRIRWEQIVGQYGLDDLYQVIFRPLSNDGAHCSVDSLNRHALVDGSGSVVGIKCGPDTAGLEDALSQACIALLWAMRPLVEIYALKDPEKRLGEWSKRYSAMVDPQPAAA